MQNSNSVDFELKLESFNGPMDLLLHLIEKQEIDIYDIPISTITAQYLDYLFSMDTLNMEIASSFVVMASTLLSVKVRMLLPKKELVFAEINDEEDPRAELVRQLLAYRQFKLLSKQFNSLEKGQALYRFGNTLLPYKEDKAIDPGLGPITITDLVQIFSKALDAYTANAPTITISREDIPVREKIEYILMMIINHKRGIAFSKLIRNPQSKHEHVVTLLAILELARSKYISITQNHSFKEITIFCKEAGGQFDG